MLRICVLAILVLLTVQTFGQARKDSTSEKGIKLFQNDVDRKGRFFFYWGYNRSGFTKSDIHFEGEGYDLLLTDVDGSDAPSKFDADVYLNPANFTIPQFNIRFGYFLNDRLSLSFGVDHMKYFMNYDQTVEMTGYIDTVGGTRLEFDKNETVVGNNFLYMEHSDGFNYASLELEYNLPVWISHNKKFYADVLGNVGAGFMYPKTMVYVMNDNLDNKWHISGGGLSVKAGVRFTFWTNFFFETAAKTGYVWMPNVLTTEIGSAKAKQNLGWFETHMVLGFSIPLGKK